MATSRRTSCLCVVLLLVGVWASVPTGAASQVEELTKVLPDDLLFSLATSGGDAVKGDFDQSILGRIWNEPTMQSFVSSIATELMGKIRQEASADGDFPQTAEKVLDYARLVLRRPVVVGLARVEAEEGPPACLFAIVDAGEREADLEAAITTVEQMLGDTATETQVGAFKMHEWKNESDLPLYWGWVGNRLVVAANDAQGKVLKYLGAPREAVPSYMEKLPGHGDVLAVYYDHAGCMSVVDALVAEEGGAERLALVKAVLADLGLTHLGTMVTRVGFAGPDLVSSAYVQIPEPRTGLFAALGHVDSSAFALVDLQAVTATAANWNLAAVYDTVMKAIETASPDDAYPKAQKGLAEFEAQAQFRIRDGLLKSLAGPTTFYAIPAGKTLDAPMGGFVVVAKLADAKLFEETVTALGEFVSAKAEGMLQIGSQTDETGRTIHVWSSQPLALAQLMPTWCVVQDQVVIGSSTPLCKMGIARIVSKGEGTKALLDTDGYKQVAARLPDGLLGLTYIDSQTQFNQMLMQMQQAWPMVVMATTQGGVKLPVMLPSLGQIGQDMHPACGYSYLRPDGLYSHYQGPGVEMSIQSTGGVVLGMGILMPALARVRQLAYRMTSGTNLSGIGKACLIYAHTHDDKLPPDLETLVREVQVPPKALESKLKPADFDGPSYIYVAGQNMNMSARNVLAYENPVFCIDGVNVLFLDSHVEFMRPDEFRDALWATCNRLGRKMPTIRFKDEKPSPEVPRPAGELRAQDPDASGPALREAAQRGDMEAIRRLLDEGAEIDASDAKGQTPLCLALVSGHAAAASLLIEAGADINLKAGTWGTPLLAAVRLGHDGIARMLIDRGADVNAQLAGGWTPLLLAARFGHTDTARLLLDAGADMNARTDEQMTPLLFAVLHTRPEIERLLMDRGAQSDIFAESMRGDAEAVEAWLQKDPSLANVRLGHFTPLHWAAYCGHVDVARVLLEHGADVNAHAEYVTPLHWAVRKNHVELARLLLSHGAHVNEPGHEGIRVIHQVVSPEMVDLLAEYGADVNVRSTAQTTPLHVVVSVAGHREVLKTLLPEDADIGLEYPDELHRKAAEQQAAIVEALLKHGADVNAAVGGRITALDVAEKLRYEPVVQTLRQHGGQRGLGLQSSVPSELPSVR